MRLALPRTPVFDPPPPAAPAALASRLEPLAMTAALLALSRGLDGPLQPAQIGAALLMLALTHPAPLRGTPRPPRGLAQRWLQHLVLDAAPLALVLLLCAWAAGAGPVFSPAVALGWLMVAPALPPAIEAGCQALLRPPAPGASVVLGSGAPAERVAQALQEQHPRQPVLRMQAADLRHALTRQTVRAVYLALPTGASTPGDADLEAVLSALKDSTASVYWVPDLDSLASLGVMQGRLTTLGRRGEVPVIGLLESPFTGWPGVVKRASDLAIAGVAVLLLAPLMALIALAVRLDSPGPVLFRQRRHGLNGQPIEVWKFRTMHTLEDGPLVRQAERSDARVTRLGRLLRRTSLDELPQFFNVLQGRMSVVGPRPHAWAHNEQYRSLIDAYMLRHKVRPGITGWAQVNGLRGQTSELAQMRARLAHDLAYLQHWSLGLDLRIVALTALRMWTDDHAW